MVVNRIDDYLLETTRYCDPTTSLFYAWFSDNGRLLGFSKAATMDEACHAALDEWMNDAGAEKDEPTLDAWHTFKSALMGERSVCPAGWDHT